MKYKRPEHRYESRIPRRYSRSQRSYSGGAENVEMNWNELTPYKAGKTPEGQDKFLVSLPKDGDGMVGRECKNPDCKLKYFKISGDIPAASKVTAEHVTDAELTCPYCCAVGHGNLMFTEAQMDWISQMMLNAATQTFQDMMSRTLRGSKHVTFKADPLPPTPPYVEEKLKRLLACGTCGFRYAVYGISIRCPLCGCCDLGQQLVEHEKTIRTLIAEAERLRAEHGDRVAEAMEKNAVEDIVTMFEGFLRQIYRHAVTKKFSKQEAEKLLKQVRNSFQNVELAQQMFKAAFGMDILMGLKAAELKAFEMVFAKRHVIAHNLGLVDEKIQNKGLSLREGMEVPLSRTEIEQAVACATRVLTSAAEVLR